MAHEKQREPALPILTYHSIDTSGSVISVCPEVFREQMALLAGSSISVIPLSEVMSCFREGRQLPPRSVAITFDDGYRNVYDVAYPVLREFGFPATVFVIAGRCGQDNRWHGQPANVPRVELLSWGQIREMAEDSCIDFGAHTMTHPDLAQISPHRAEEEIVQSKRAIQDQIGQEVRSFAYPYGSLALSTRRIIRKHFDGACSTQLANVGICSDLYALPRIDMHYFARNNRLRLLGTPQFTRYLQWRNMLRSVRIRFTQTKAVHRGLVRHSA